MFCCGEIGAPRWRIRPPEDEAEEPVLPDLLPPHGAYVSFVESDVIFFIIRGAFKNPRWNRPHSLGFRIHFSLKYAPDLLIYQSEAKKGSCKDSREHESTRLGGRRLFRESKRILAESQFIPAPRLNREGLINPLY